MSGWTRPPWSPTAKVVGRGRARAVVAGRGRDENAGGVSVEEGQLGRVGKRLGAARDREVDDVDAIEDGLLDSGGRVGVEAALRAADLVLDDPRTGAMPLSGPRSTPNIGAVASTLPAEVDAVCVPWPSLSRAVSGTRRHPVRVVGRRGTAAADQLVVADEYVGGRRERVVAEVAPAGRRRAGGAGRLPRSAKDGCSGQTPVSRLP